MEDVNSQKLIKEELSEFIFEIRFKPVPSILDLRGELTNKLSALTNLEHWAISQNRIDVHDHKEDPEKAMERCFISFKNAGWLIRGNHNHRQFIKNCKSLINFWFSKDEIFDKGMVKPLRIGVKFKYGDKYLGSFESLLSLYKNRYLSPSDNIQSIFNASLKDIGGFLALKGDDGMEIQTMSGPMQNDQIKKYFPFVENPPETILYFEIDSSMSPTESLHYKRVENLVEDLIENNWASHSKLYKLMEE